MSTSGRSARRAGTTSRLGATGLALLPLLLTLPAEADERVPPRCAALDGAAGYCLDEPSLRVCDAAESALPEVRVQLRVAEQRLVVAAGDALVLSRALDAQSGVVAGLRRELRTERARWPWGTWLAIGSAVTLVVEAVVVGLVLWAD